MSGQIVGDDSLALITAFGQTEMIFLRDIAEHGGTEMADDGGSNGACDVVVACSDVGS